VDRPHQGIAFDVSGGLIDGQNRLAAVVEADVPVAMTVLTAVDDDAVVKGRARRAPAGRGGDE
jgi:hypothetical protein